MRSELPADRILFTAYPPQLNDQRPGQLHPRSPKPHLLPKCNTQPAAWQHWPFLQTPKPSLLQLPPWDWHSRSNVQAFGCPLCPAVSATVVPVHMPVATVPEPVYTREKNVVGLY